MREREVIVLGDGVHQYGMALVECAALRILTRETDGIAFEKDRAKGQRLREAIVNGALSLAHLGTLLYQLHDLRMNVEAFGNPREAFSYLSQFFAAEAGVYFVFRF